MKPWMEKVNALTVGDIEQAQAEHRRNLWRTDKDNALYCLAGLDPATLDYQAWLTVGMGLKAAGASVADWEAWSRSDSARFQEGVCAAKWATFKGSGVGVGSLIKMLKDAGGVYPPTGDTQKAVAPLPNSSPLVSFFNRCNDTTGRDAPLAGLLADIRSGKWAAEVAAVRAAVEDGRPKKEIASLKARLPAFTPSGRFRTRDKNGFAVHSGYLVGDIDKLTAEDAVKLRDRLARDPHTLAAFVSPSGRGVKTLVRVAPCADAAEHEAAFAALVAHYADRFGIALDTSGRDVCRLCFASHDSDAFIREGAATPFKWNGEAEDRTRGGALVDTYPPMRFGQLQALKIDPDANYIAGNGFFRRGAWSLFTGGTGIGKSVAVEQTAACLACGKDVFGLKVARPFKVLLLTAENDEETLKRDLEAIAEHEVLDPELLDANLQIHHAYALDGRELVDALQSEMVRGGFDMAILDNYQAFSGDDINGSKEWKQFITPLAKMLKELRAAMLLVDHTGKPTERKGWGVNDSVYMAAGTSRKSNGARTSIELYSPTDGDTRYRLHFGKCWERTGIYDEYGHMVRDVYLDRSPSANHPYWTPSEDQSPPVMGGGGKPVVELPDDEAVALLGGVAFSKEQTRTKLRAAGVSRDGATDHIRRLLVSGKLVSWSPSIPHPPTYVGTPEAIEKIKAEMAERAQGKLPLGGQTSQTSQTSRRKSGKSRRP